MSMSVMGDMGAGDDDFLGSEIGGFGIEPDRGRVAEITGSRSLSGCEVRRAVMESGKAEKLSSQVTVTSECLRFDVTGKVNSWETTRDSWMHFTTGCLFESLSSRPAADLSHECDAAREGRL